MSCHLNTGTKIYRNFIFVSTCVTMFLRAIFILGTLPVLSNYYEARFDDRKLSPMIGSVQTSLQFLTSLPIYWLSTKIGIRWIHIIGGILPCIGMIGTAFSTEAWHALIFNGILTGIGSGFLSTSGFTILSMYFTKKNQVVPFVTVGVALGVGCMLSAKTISFMNGLLGFRYCLCVTGISMLLNVLIGLFYRSPDSSSLSDNTKQPPQTAGKPQLTKRCSMIFTSKSQGLFELTNERTLVPQADANIDRQEEKHRYDQQGKKLAESETYQGTNSTSDNNIPCGGKLRVLKKFIKERKLVALMMTACSFAHAGSTAGASIIADYAAFKLLVSQDNYDLAVTIQGLTQLCTGLVYIFVAQMSAFSSVAVFSLGSTGLAIALISMLFQPNLMQFYVIMALIGVATSFIWSSDYAQWVNVVGPQHATQYFVTEITICGVVTFPTSLIAAYLQVEVDVNAGLYLAVGLLLCSALIALPAIISSMIAPKVYTTNKDNIKITQLSAFSLDWAHQA